MSENPVGKDRRKYQRVLFEASPQSFSVALEGYGESVVFDMSYSGAALGQPEGKKVEAVGESLKLRLVTDSEEAEVDALIIRATEKVIACEFSDISSTARVIIDRLVTDRIIGLNMQLIDPTHYSPQSDFTHWFHGPKETNLFLWEENGKLLRAQFDLNQSVLIYEEESFFFENKDINRGTDPLNNQQVILKAESIIAQMNSDIKVFQEFKKVILEQIG